MNEIDRAQLIAALAHLGHPFDRKQISKLPATEKRPALDYVNHAHVTNRLNQYAPDWSYTLDEVFTQNGECWVRGTMTILGASRVEFGKGKNPLEAVSHFIRRAAMRFGVATDLWAKEDFESEDDDAAPKRPAASPALGKQAPPGPPQGTLSAPEALGEGANGAEPLASDSQWADLLSMLSGKTAGTAQVLNERNGTNYASYREAKARATRAELEAVLP